MVRVISGDAWINEVYGIGSQPVSFRQIGCDMLYPPLAVAGFYAVDPVSGDYVFGAPQLPKIVLHLADGKTFTVIAENLSKEHKYVDSITLNGEPYTKNTISHEDILKGGTLVYKMK